MNASPHSEDVAETSPGEAQAVSAAATVLEEAEPWESWETRLCVWSLGIGIAALVVLGVVVNMTILS